MPSEWISVKDRLPEVYIDGAYVGSVRVLVSVMNGGWQGVTIGRYVGDSRVSDKPFWNVSPGVFGCKEIASNVTHWMPMPALSEDIL